MKRKTRELIRKAALRRERRKRALVRSYLAETRRELAVAKWNVARLTKANAELLSFYGSESRLLRDQNIRLMKARCGNCGRPAGDPAQRFGELAAPPRDHRHPSPPESTE